METNSSAHLARGVLIGRIETLAIGQIDAALSFEGRLAAENGWTQAFAVRVAREYRRFLALMALSDEPLTPSDAIDQAWHLHMVYTRDYWHGLCRDILGRDMHHEPTAGGPEHREQYRRQYSHTLELYRATFGASPPADIWPAPAERFSGRFQRVDLTRTTLLDARMARWIRLGAAGLAVAAIVGMKSLGALLPIGVVIVLMILSASWNTRRSGRRTRSGSDSCTADFSYGDGADNCDGGDGGCGGGCGGE